MEKLADELAEIRPNLASQADSRNLKGHPDYPELPWDRRERRQAKRYGIKSSTVRYREGGWLSFMGSTSPRYLLLNISASGCHFISKRELPIGSKVTLFVEALQVQGIITARGEVVWCRHSEELQAYKVGVQFKGMSRSSRAPMKRLLDGAILERVEVTTRSYLKGIEKL